MLKVAQQVEKAGFKPRQSAPEPALLSALLANGTEAVSRHWVRHFMLVFFSHHSYEVGIIITPFYG